jgi:hypothetical protein
MSDNHKVYQFIVTVEGERATTWMRMRERDRLREVQIPDHRDYPQRNTLG